MNIDRLGIRTFVCALVLAAAQASAQTLSPSVRQLVVADAPVIALTHVVVIDGTGSPARADQTLVIDHGVIRAVGDAARTTVPAGATILDLRGHAVLPGYVMLHEHLFYPSGDGTSYYEQGYSFPRLYLAGGVTTIRSGGNLAGYADLNIKRAIDAGLAPGPHIDATAPYLDGVGQTMYQMKVLTSPDDARRMVAYWADEGATSYKAYTYITRAELGAAIAEAHKRGLKVTGHLCSVTYHESIQLGIDNLEHGIHDASDFIPGKKPDQCPVGVLDSVAKIDMASEPVKALIRELIAHRVAVTATLPNAESYTPRRPPLTNRVLDVMSPEAQLHYFRRRASIDADTLSPWVTLFPKELEFERDFFRAGGLLLNGTDPESYGGVIPGFANQRALELLVEAGLTPIEAIKVSTLNGAQYLGRSDHIGSIAVGKNADLVVVEGDPSTNIADVEKVTIVFKDGVGFDSPALFASVRGHVGVN